MVVVGERVLQTELTNLLSYVGRTLDRWVDLEIVGVCGDAYADSIIVVACDAERVQRSSETARRTSEALAVKFVLPERP